MSDYTIYHNPRCSKSRQTLQLLEDNSISPKIVLYLQDVPSKASLKKIITQLGIQPRELLRKGEADYKSNNLADTNLSDAQLIDAMHQYPKIIERPIVVKGGSAVLGRPPENVLDLIK